MRSLRKLLNRRIKDVRRIKDGRIPNDILYEEVTARKRNPGRPQLRYRDVCKRDMNELSIEKNKLEELATDRSKWIT